MSVTKVELARESFKRAASPDQGVVDAYYQEVYERILADERARQARRLSSGSRSVLIKKKSRRGRRK